VLKALAREALPSLLEACKVLPSELGENVGNQGAIAVAEYFSGRFGGAA
jgi:hypothetical protein